MTVTACKSARGTNSGPAAATAMRAAKTFFDRISARYHVAHPNGNAEKAV